MRDDAPDNARPTDFDTVHAPLAHWAARRPKAMAIDDGALRLTFEALAGRVEAGAEELRGTEAPAAIWVDSRLAPGAQLVRFLEIVAAGHVAAIGDPDWPPELERQVMERLHPPSATRPRLPRGSFYIGFTSGSTGLPKGFVRSHRSWTTSFAACLEAFGPAAATPLLAPGRLSHSLFLFGALLGIWTGAGVHLQPRFSARAALRTLLKGEARSLVAVPSQLILMLEEAQRHGPGVVEATQLVMISGAPWPRARTPHLRALFPHARIVEFYGTSETSFIAWTDSRPDLPAAAVGRPFANVELRIAAVDGAREEGNAPGSTVPTGTLSPVGRGQGEGAPSFPERSSALTRSASPTRPLPAGERVAGASRSICDGPNEEGNAPVPPPGLIYVRSPMLFTDYVTPEEPAALLRDGDWLSVGDLGHLDADGLLHLAGRRQRMFVVQGKNLFPEEVEHVLAEHPAVASASVLAVADAVRGLRAVAVLDLAAPVDRATLARWCRARLEPYKTPYRFYACESWPRTASGKTDHAALARLLAAEPQGPADWRELPWRLASR